MSASSQSTTSSSLRSSPKLQNDGVAHQQYSSQDRVLLRSASSGSKASSSASETVSTPSSDLAARKCSLAVSMQSTRRRKGRPKRSSDRWSTSACGRNCSSHMVSSSSRLGGVTRLADLWRFEGVDCHRLLVPLLRQLD